MTEAEAKTKACCGPPQIAAQMMGGVVAANRPAKCAGGICMAWRWVNPDSEAPDGYCGLAGRP